MIPIVFINCRDVSYVDLILSGRKCYETRTRNMLGKLTGERILIAETGNGKPVVRCSAILFRPNKITDEKTWDEFRYRTCVPHGAKHDWNADTSSKYLYFIAEIQPVSPFVPPDGKRHGRVWMEYDGEYMENGGIVHAEITRSIQC